MKASSSTYMEIQRAVYPQKRCNCAGRSCVAAHRARTRLEFDPSSCVRLRSQAIGEEECMRNRAFPQLFMTPSLKEKSKGLILPLQWSRTAAKIPRTNCLLRRETISVKWASAQHFWNRRKSAQLLSILLSCMYLSVHCMFSLLTNNRNSCRTVNCTLRHRSLCARSRNRSPRNSPTHACQLSEGRLFDTFMLISQELRSPYALLGSLLTVPCGCMFQCNLYVEIELGWTLWVGFIDSFL